MVTTTGNFFQLFNSKVDKLGLYTSNTVSSNSLSPVLAKFKNFITSPHLLPKLQLEQVCWGPPDLGTHPVWRGSP